MGVVLGVHIILMDQALGNLAYLTYEHFTILRTSTTWYETIMNNNHEGDANQSGTIGISNEMQT